MRGASILLILSETFSTHGSTTVALGSLFAQDLVQ